MAKTKAKTKKEMQADLAFEIKAKIMFVNPQNSKTIVVALFMQERLAKIAYQALLKDNLQNQTLYQLVTLK